MRQAIVPLALAGCLLTVTPSRLQGADWPTYQHDNARSGVTEEQLPVPLRQAWVWQAAQPPRPAWPAPAPRDIWHELRELKPLVTYDRAFHPVSVGDTVFIGSSADDSVRALDAGTGQERWAFYTEGPVRLAPAIAAGKVYAGSDDGAVYCLDAATGALLWKHVVQPQARRLPGNGRIISSVPVRSGVLVEDNRAYVCAGLFPSEGVLRCALQASSGEVIWKEATPDLSPQGYLLASPTRLFVPTGRTTPAIFRKDSGKFLRAVGGTGGSYALLLDDLLYARADREGNVGLTEGTTGERIASFDGLAMIVKGGRAYLHTQTELSALDRVRHTALARQRNAAARRLQDIEAQRKQKSRESVLAVLERERAEVRAQVRDLETAMEACFDWRQACDCPYNLILAGEVLFVGGDDQVVAYPQAGGKPVWTGAVKGRAYGLSVANGRLFVSTDAGSLHCFRAQQAPTRQPNPPQARLPAATVAANSERCVNAAEQILAQTKIRRGYCLVLGCEDGQLAMELARRTELQIVGVEDDPRKVAAARMRLADAGLYGTRVVVQEGALDPLPYGPYLFNLIVSERMLRSGTPPIPAAAVDRLLRPSGGMACLGVLKDLAPQHPPDAYQAWLQPAKLADARVQTTNGCWVEIRRGAVPNSGEWTQLYADAAHTACSSDELRGPMAIQWFGEPGPRRIVDRHHRPMSSLVKDGRVFVPGDDVVFAVDAYNGTPLWQLEVPNMRRVGALKDCGHMLVVDNLLYIAAEGACWVVDVETGRRTATLKVPPGLAPGLSDWGYLNQVDDQLIGSGQALGASFRQLDKSMINTIEGDFRPVIVSRCLFAIDRHTGEARWTYRDGTLMNNAIAIGDGRVFCVESRNPNARANTNGRLGIREFCASETYLVSLDLKTGRKLHERPIRLPFEHILFLSYAQNTVLLTGTYNREDRVYYGLFAFQGDTGKPKWDTRYLALDVRANEPAATEGSHGEQWQHPVIMGNRIYSRPYDFDLLTGEKGRKKILRGGHGCGGWTASAHYLFGRGSNPRMYDVSLDSTEGDPLTQVSRPGCWLNIIPAGGLVLIPESSSGCTCSYPIQTSLALVPRALLR